jgi:hypothetical protein
METQVKSIQDENGNTHEEWDEIAGEGVNFYSRLFASRLKLDKDILKEIVATWKVKITEEKKASMEGKPTLEEYFTAASKVKNQAPGPDGVPVQLSLTQWESLGPLVLGTLLEGLETFSMSTLPSTLPSPGNPPFLSLCSEPLIPDRKRG